MRHSESLDLLAGALQNFQQAVGNVPKDSFNPFFKSKYAGLPACVETAQRHLHTYGLAVAQFPSTVDGKPALTTTLLHISGQWMEDDAVLVLGKEDPQGQGASITYMRRFAYCAVLGLVADEDDDGNAAANHSTGGTSRGYGGGGTVATPARSSPGPHDNLRTENQGKALYAISKNRGFVLREYIAERFNKPEKELTFDEARDLIDELNSAPAEQGSF